jgi:cell division protein FtsW
MGGTSLIFTSAAFGMILSVSNWANEEEKRLNEEAN